MSRRGFRIGAIGIATLGYLLAAAASPTGHFPLPMDPIGPQFAAASPTANASRITSPGQSVYDPGQLVLGTETPAAGEGRRAKRERAVLSSPLCTEASATKATRKGVRLQLHHRASCFLLFVADEAAARHGAPAYIVKGLIEDESSWNPEALSAGGDGLMQVSLTVAAECGIADRLNPVENVDCGTWYLAEQFKTFGSWELAIVAYKAGPSRLPEQIPLAAWGYTRRVLLKAEAYR